MLTAHCIAIVLISTYWNVNAEMLTIGGCVGTVLISTYWNVNEKDFKLLVQDTFVLISTYWNVNLDKDFIELEKRKGF